MRAEVFPDIAISARNVTLSFGTGDARTDVLKGIDLDIHNGETIGILGPSGSGKSSLMAVLSGLEQVSAGQVLVAGTDFGALDEDALSRARRGKIGIVLQSFHLLPTMTALENVAVPLELSGRSATAFEKAREELEAVGLGHRLGHYPAQLSGGEQQRVAIARATAPAPQIIFADEPTGNLDGVTGAAIIDLLFARQKATGATLIMITHDPSLAAHCDRILEMHDGLVAVDRAA
jgi:putative ABC transport system ATP-binding protein